MKYFKMYLTIGLLLMLTLTVSAKNTKTNYGQERSQEVHNRNAERYIEKHNLSEFYEYENYDVIEILGYLKDIQEIVTDLDISNSEREAILDKIEKIEEEFDLEDEDIDEEDDEENDEDEDNEEEIPDFIKGKAIIIPTKMITEGMGLDLYYDGDDEVIITDWETWMEFDIDHLSVIVNDKVHLLDPEEVPYAPLDFIAEKFELYDDEENDEDEDNEDEIPDFIKGKAIIIPIKMITEGMGLDLYYDGDDKVIITDWETWMEFDIDHLSVIVNDKVHLLDPEEVPYAPLDFIAEQFELYDDEDDDE